MTIKKKRKQTGKAVCGLCGKRGTLVATRCCNNLICDDNENYVLFSFARNSCWRNHDRYTLCASHTREGHKGDWQKCKKCRDDFDTEDYVWYATNEYNFVKLKNPPTFQPTHCARCDSIINRGTDGYAQSGSKYFCVTCEPM